MKTRIIFLITIMMLLMVACGHTEDTQSSTETDTPSDNTSGVSILIFQNDEGAAKLVSDMEEGRIPVECRAMYDEMGARPEVVITDPDTITEVYNRLGEMTIGEEANESVTDCYHYIKFTLQDGSTVGWNFEGTELLCRGQINYRVTNPGSLWSMIRSMQEDMNVAAVM